MSKFVENASISRQHRANPHAGEILSERLAVAGSIDLRNNSRIIDEGNGYGRIEPIDKTKKFTTAPAE